MKSFQKSPSTLILIVAFLILTLLVVGCDSNLQPSATAVNSATPGYPAIQPSTGYPAPQQLPEYPAPGNQSTQGFTPMKTYAPGEFPPAPTSSEPVAGMGSISGVLFSTSNRSAIPSTMFYLTPGTGENNDEVPPVITGPGENDLVYNTDENGEFNIPDVAPGVYYLIMSAQPYDWALGYQDTTPTLLKMTIEANSKNDFGVIFIYWP